MSKASCSTANWSPINLALFEDHPPPQPTIGTGRIVYPGARHIFSGEPESGKTIAGYATLLEEVRAGHHVVLADFEMGPEQAKLRLRELGATDDDLAAVLYVEPTAPPTTDDYRILLDYRPTVALFDAAPGAYDLADLEDNKRQDAERFAAIFIRPFWQAGVATILVDHVTKSKETRGRYTIGSERKLGGADVHLGFEVVKTIRRGSEGHVKITTHKDRFGFLTRPHAAELHLVSDPDTHQISWAFKAASTTTGDADGFRPTNLMEKVSRHLELVGTTQTRSAICDAINGKRAFVLVAIDVLVAEGYAKQNDGPRNSKLVQTVQPYRESFPVPEPFPAVPGTGEPESFPVPP